MKKIYSSIMAVALFASALSCTSGGNTNDAGTQTAQTQALDSDGIPTGGEWITMFDGKTLNGWRGYCRQDVPQGWVVEDGSITYKGSDNKADTGFGDLIYGKKFKNFVSRSNGRSTRPVIAVSSIQRKKLRVTYLLLQPRISVTRQREYAGRMGRLRR